MDRPADLSTQSFPVPAGDWVRGWRLDGFGQVPAMAGPERL
jgi:hypothetical protein